jgi:orotidine-5'-phosphate decarboxylase
MPHTFFLVPGYGAQGGKGADLRGFFDKDGRGCVVNSSRGIIAAWQKDKRFGEGNVGEAAREAVLAMRADLREALS